MKTLLITLGVVGSLALFTTSASAALDDEQALALMKKSGCAACHAVDKKRVGPAFKDVALKRKSDTVASLEKAVRAGSKDVYGAIPMPSVSPDKISDADLHDLMEWILTK